MNKIFNFILSFFEESKSKGVYVRTTAFLETAEQFALDARIKQLRDSGADSSVYMPLIRQLNSICRTESVKFCNILPTVGRAMWANNLASATPTNVMKITHGALGSSATAVANGDTQLGTETYRNTIASLQSINNVVYATAFFSATECSGTYNEAGIFSNGTGSANSGVIVSHVNTTFTKTTAQAETLDWTLTIN